MSTEEQGAQKTAGSKVAPATGKLGVMVVGLVWANAPITNLH